MNNKRKVIESDSIDFVLIVSKLWKDRIKIFKTTLIFFIIGLTYSISLNNKYKASSIFYPY